MTLVVGERRDIAWRVMVKCCVTKYRVIYCDSTCHSKCSRAEALNTFVILSTNMMI